MMDDETETENTTNGAEPKPETVTLDDLAHAARNAGRDIGGLISRVDHLETSIRRTDRQVLMMIGMVTVLIYSVRQIAARMPDLAERVADAADAA
jgi:hypothetical protein